MDQGIKAGFILLGALFLGLPLVIVYIGPTGIA